MLTSAGKKEHLFFRTPYSGSFLQESTLISEANENVCFYVMVGFP